MKKLYFLLAALYFVGNLNAQIVNIPDTNFKNKLLAADVTNDTAVNFSDANFKLDANSNGEIEVAEALLVKNLKVSNAAIVNLTGINAFSNMVSLNCRINSISNFVPINTLPALRELYCGSNQIASVNFSNLGQLRILSCYGNLLTTLDVTSLIHLESLGCYSNGMTSLNLTGLTNLTNIACYDNLLTTLDLSTFPNLWNLEVRNNQLTTLNYTSTVLERLSCQNNQITSLNFSNVPLLYSIDCRNNQITSLDVSNLPNLSLLHCSENLLTTIDVSNLNNLTNFNFQNNPQLTSVLLKNGVQFTALWVSGNPNLQYICADESQFSQIQTILTSWGMTNVQLNSYCNFHPGGPYYIIQGSKKIDYNNDGCDVSDTSYQNLKFNISNGTIGSQIISNGSGNYSIPVQAGTHTLTPVFENPSYYSVSPANVVVIFPTTASPFTQNFCITPNGIHNDLEISILPLNVARPGFDANYKLVYKNKGNQVQSGNVNLVFNDAVLDLVTSTPVVSNLTTNSLTWDFSNLLPFESRQIYVTLNVNSPMETPPINSGDVLNYIAHVSDLTDETPDDNTAMLNQTALNSFDPNDKRCLEGTTISPETVGQYVHYLIRFENTGTFPAENIVVKDMIDLAKFNIATLVPTNGSHPFVTHISQTNKVEFIFENINLPFDDANNDGYIAFKIKTKPTLVVGNTFSNNASIYFDYNFPIVTNTATTTIQALANPDFEFSDYVTLAPNPAKNVLNIQIKNDIEISSVNIYNTLGQLVLVVTEPTSAIDVSSLKTGNYFVKVVSDKGSSNGKFIKI